MFGSKSDLYRTEWLDLVFDDRNKEYGAYDLRKHYGGNMMKAMGIAFAGVAVLGFSCSLLFKSHPIPKIITDAPFQKIITVTLRQRVVTPKQVKHITTQSAPHSPTIKYTTMVIGPDPISTNPPAKADLIVSTIGPETAKGTGPGLNVLKSGTGDGGPIDPGAKVNTNDPVDVGGLEVLPEPYGGAAAWSKFLQKNIHYPGQASDAGKSGKVFLSFIIERDGHLSNITVMQGPGYGLDEEALRVLKLAPAWKPGKQNGQPVRVKYTIPISFVIPDAE